MTVLCFLRLLGLRGPASLASALGFDRFGWWDLFDSHVRQTTMDPPGQGKKGNDNGRPEADVSPEWSPVSHHERGMCERLWLQMVCLPVCLYVCEWVSVSE